MKKTLTFSLLIFTQLVYAQWNELPKNGGSKIIQFYNYNSDTIYVCTDTDVFLKSSTNNWEKALNRDYYDTTQINSLIKHNGFIYASFNTGQLKRSADNGLTWFTLSPSNVVKMISKSDTLFVLDNSNIQFTFDNGLNWSTITGISTIKSMLLLNNYLVVGNNSGVKYSSLNDLSVWNNWNIGITSGNIIDFTVSNDSLFCLKTSGVIYKNNLNPGFNSWININQNVAGTNVNNIHFHNDSLFFSAGKYIFYKTNNIIDTVENTTLLSSINDLTDFNNDLFIGTNLGVYTTGNNNNEDLNIGLDNKPFNYPFIFKNTLFNSNGSDLTFYFDESSNKWKNTTYFNSYGLKSIVELENGKSLFFNNSGLYFLYDTLTNFNASIIPDSIIQINSATDIRNTLVIGDTIFYCNSTGIKRSLNDGFSWGNVNLGLSDPTKIYGLFKTSNNIVYAQSSEGINSKVYKSTDLGLTWNVLFSSTYIKFNVINDTLYRVFAINEGYPTLQYSVDLGITWVDIYIRGNNVISDCSALNHTQINDVGIIYKFNSDLIFLDDNSFLISKNNSLFHRMNRGISMSEIYFGWNERFKKLFNLKGKYIIYTSYQDFYARDTSDIIFPAQATDVTKELIATNTYKFTWTDNANNETSYYVYRYHPGYGFIVQNNIEEFTVFTDTLPSTFAPNYFPCQVIVTNVDGDLTYSDGLNHLGIDLNEEIMFSIYPNPTKQNIIIESVNVISDLTIYSVNGKTINVNMTKQNDKNYLVDLSSLDSGIYFVQLTYMNKNKTMKIIKQ